MDESTTASAEVVHPRDVLAQAIRDHREWDDDEGTVLADALLAEFVIVPRSNIERYEYGVRYTHPKGHIEEAPIRALRESAAAFVERRRAAQIRLAGSSDATLVQRPILPFMLPDEDGQS